MEYDVFRRMIALGRPDLKSDLVDNSVRGLYDAAGISEIHERDQRALSLVQGFVYGYSTCEAVREGNSLEVKDGIMVDRQKSEIVNSDKKAR
jgi:hypothetical protein